MRLFKRKSAPDPVEVVSDPGVESMSAVAPEPEPDPVGPYTGPRCWIHADQYQENGDGTYRLLYEGGWHYSVRTDDNGNEHPDRKLHLNDASPDERDWFYEYAQPHHKSWVEKHGVGHLVPISALRGDHPPEALDRHPDHERYRRENGFLQEYVTDSSR